MSNQKAGPRITRTDSEWRSQLTPEAYRVTREHGTEPAFSGPHVDEHRQGMFTCVGCGEALFEAGSKFESGTGWPSFYEPVNTDAIAENVDRKLFMKRTEVRCAACDAHLGHVFPDGPQPTGLRYCMNGVALEFNPDESRSETDG